MLRQNQSCIFRKSATRFLDIRFQPKLEHLESRDLPSAATNIQLLDATILQTPTDPGYGNTWGLPKISAPSAWDKTTGSSNVVVANIDTGVDYTHPDLYLNIWLNPGEVPQAVKDLKASLGGSGAVTFRDLNQKDSSGQWVYGSYVSDVNGNTYIDAGDLLTLSYWNNGDSDNNGYKDDLIGWNFVNNTNNPWDGNGHGTHTSGTIGALANNGIGVAGVAWEVQIMPLKFIADDGSGDLNWAASAIRYSADKGAKVSNNSWGYYNGYAGDVVYNAIAYAQSKGQLFVAAAGNDGFNNDSSPWRNYPASFPLTNIISVAATTSSDAKASWSNYGRTSVDLGAPGVSILSTLPGGKYGYGSGTSMATPHVTGTAALLLSLNPNLSYSSLKSAILQGVDKVTSLSKTVSGGRLNAAKALSIGTGSTLSLDGGSGASGGTTSGGGSSGKGNIKSVNFLEDQTDTTSIRDQLPTIRIVFVFIAIENQGFRSFNFVTPILDANVLLFDSPVSPNAILPTTRGPSLISSSGAGSNVVEETAETPPVNPQPAQGRESTTEATESRAPRQRLQRPEQGNQAAPVPQLPAPPQPDVLEVLFSEETQDVSSDNGSDPSALPVENRSGQWHLEAAMIYLFSFLGGCRMPEDKEKNRKNHLQLSA